MPNIFDKINFDCLGESEGVRDWQGLQILATFDDENNQPNITTSELSFVGPIGKAIIDYIDGGVSGDTNGIFEGPDFSMSLDTPNTSVFSGILDLADDITIDRGRNEVKCKLLKLDGLNTFANVSEAITMGLLVAEGKITPSDYVDIPYVKETEFEFLTAAMLVISILTIKRELNAIATEASYLAGEVTAMFATGLTGSLAAALWTVGKLAANLIYFGLMLASLIETVDQLLDLLISIKKKHRGIKLKTILEKGCELAGYTFSSSIPELDDLYYLPRKTTEGKKLLPASEEGIPISGGPLYTLGKVVGLVKDLFLAKVKIIDDVVHIEPKNNTAFWERDSNYVLKDVLVESTKYNTNELISTKVIEFSTDTNDFFTLNNYEGTVYEIKTLPKSIGDRKKVLMKGLNQITFPVALGTRKTELNIAEKTIKVFAKIADSLVKAFGGRARYEAQMTDRTNILKMSSDLVSVPKLMRLNSSYNLDADYREKWSAKYLYDNYHNWDSFVLNDFRNQYELYQGVKMNATFQDFLDIVQNSVVDTADGRKAKFESVLYNFGGGFWEADYRIQSTYTENIEEIYTQTK